MNFSNYFLKYCLVAVLLLLAQGALHAEDESALPPLPSAVKKTSVERKMHDIQVADMVEGSPEWVNLQSIRLCRKRDFDALVKYVSPENLADYKRQIPKTMATLVNYINIDTIVSIGDVKLEADRGYMYVLYPPSEDWGSWTGGYCYFLRLDGRWILVNPVEWQRGKCN